jgi:hypothetical protein
MVDLLTIQTVGVIVAAFSFVVGVANTIRVSFEEAKKRKIEFTNNITDTLYSEEGYKRYIDLMNLDWKSYEEYKEKYDSDNNPQVYAKRLSLISKLDQIGYMLKLGLIDEETMYQSGGSLSIWFYGRHKAIIDGYRREALGADRFINLDYLAGRMYKMAKSRDPSFMIPTSWGAIFK